MFLVNRPLCNYMMTCVSYYIFGIHSDEGQPWGSRLAPCTCTAAGAWAGCWCGLQALVKGGRES